MKIGIEVQRLFRKKKHGMEVVALELIKELQTIDKTNDYIVFVKNGEDDSCIKETNNFKVETLPGKTYFDWEQYSLPKAIRKFKPDFLHSTCNTSATNLRVPLLLTLHDIIYLEKISFKGSAYQNFGNLYRRYVVPRIVKKSKFIITVSHYERQVIIDKLNVPEEKVKVVYNAASSRFNNQYEADEIKKFRLIHQLPEKFILFLGNTAPKKNTKNVIEAYMAYCRSANEIIPLVILDYDKSHVEGHLARTNNSDLLRHFIFPGFINANEIPLIYNAATLFLYPSLRESFGLPILEAMGCGTPVITSNTSSMPEVSGNAAALVNPFDIQDIANNIFNVLSNGDVRTQLSERGIERAKDFSWHKSALDLLSLYEKM